jgi:hypothetical protein
VSHVGGVLLIMAGVVCRGTVLLFGDVEDVRSPVVNPSVLLSSPSLPCFILC